VGKNEEAVLSALAQTPTLSMDELGKSIGCTRNTAANIVKKLVKRGALTERGYFPLSGFIGPKVTGIVLIASPEEKANISRFENHLASFDSIGRWQYVTDSKYDYLFFFYVNNTHPSLSAFYAGIREIVGARCETHFLIDPVR
jgi:DNA-binding Lrp family transcriptional regulator